jgi:hypothetical protein
MTKLTNEERLAMVFDRSIRQGSKVVVRWTYDGRCFHGPGLVARLNPKSIVVALTESVGDGGGDPLYRQGHQITVPRFGHGHYSANNRAEARTQRASDAPTGYCSACGIADFYHGQRCVHCGKDIVRNHP